MKNFSYITLMIISLFFVACSGSSSQKDTQSGLTDSEKPVQDEEISANDGAINVVHLKSDDKMRFDKSEIRVQEGKIVKLTLEHTGEMPKTAMGHNFVLLKQGVVLSDFGNAAIKGEAPDYEFSEELLNDVIAHTKMIGGGESVTIEFQAPPKGEYEFLCTFPGHYGLMKGIFIVE